MKKIFLILTILCTAWFTGCDKEKDGKRTVSLMDGSIVIDNRPDVKITSQNKELDAIPTDPTWLLAGGKMMGSKSSETPADLRANDYRFKLVADINTLVIDGVNTQATHVKLTDDGYAFVSYNRRGVGNDGDPGHNGGVLVFKYTITDGTLETVKVDVKLVSSIKMSHAQVNCLDFQNGKLYMAGASHDPKFGYKELAQPEAWNYAFFAVLELNSDKTFKPVEPASGAIQQLTSFQATSIRATNDRIYITTGDGTNGTKGGLYVFSATDYGKINFVEDMDNARSVDVDANNVFMMQAEPARITRFDKDGKNGIKIYSTDEAMQHHAKSEMLVWNNYLFTALNESGLRMLHKDGEVNMWLDRPGADPERHVTNSVSMNSDVKKNAQGQDVKSNMLLLANGEKGITWYDVVNAFDKDYIVASKNNNILAEDNLSANFIASRGSIVFVAQGLGGLKVLYIGASKDGNWDCSNATSNNTTTWLKENGKAHQADQKDRKIGDIIFQAEGENLVVYIFSDKNINNSGVFFASSLEGFHNAGLLSGNLVPFDLNNIIDGKMANINSQYRTVISKQIVKFTFPKSALPNNGEGPLYCSIYTSMGWGFGYTFGESGTTGGGSNNNGQYIVLDGITFCEPVILMK